MRVCTVDRCDRKHHARDLCAPHYLRKLDGRTIAGPIRPQVRSPWGLLTDEVVVERLEECVRRGWTDRRTGMDLGVSDRTVWRWRKQLGLKGRPTGITERVL